MKKTLIPYLQDKKKHHIWLAAVVLATLLTLPIVAGMNVLLENRVTAHFLITGCVAAVLVASIVSSLIIFFLQLLSQIQQDNLQLNSIISACPVPMAINDADNNILLLNPEFIKAFGYTLDDIPTVLDWWPKAYPDKDYRKWVASTWQNRMQTMHASGEAFKPLEVKIHCKNGQIKTMIATATPLEPAYQDTYLVVLYDITEKTQHANAMLESRNILQTIIETIPMRVFWKDLDSRYLGCNNAFARDANLTSPNELIGKLDSELSWHDQADLYRADDLSVMQTNVPRLAYDEPQTTPDGQTIWLRTSKTPLCDKQSKVIGVLGVYDDITERKQIEKELWLTKTMLDNSKTAFFRLSSTGKALYVNDYACQSLGYSRKELLNMHPWDFDPDFPSSAWPAVWQKLESGETFNIESRHRRKDGSIFNVDITGHYNSYNGEEFSFTLVQDITDRKRIELALQQKEGYQRALLDNFPFEIWLKDTQSRFLAVNKVFANTFGAKNADVLIGKTDFDIASKDLAIGYRADDQAVMDTQQQKMREEEVEDIQGKKWVETFKAPVIDTEGMLLGTVGFSRDISERKRIETELRVAATAFESQEGMVITDANSIILKVNRSFTRITGFETAEVVGQKMNVLKSGVHSDDFYTNMWAAIFNTGYWQGEIWNRRKNGDIYPEWLTITAVKGAQSNVTHYVGTMFDITARKAIEDQIQHMAHYDVLTDLPNRILLTDRLHQALARVRRENAKLALMFLDLDKFKPVNDDLGHHIGDLLLQKVAYRLQKCMKRESDTVSRLGGDEFVVLLADINHDQEAKDAANRIVDALNLPFEIEQHSIHISCSVGIALYPDHARDAKNLMKRADSAMYQAKEAGRSCFRYYQATE